MPVSWIDYKGKKLLHWVYVGSDLDNFIKEMREYFECIEKSQESILSLIDLKDSSLLSSPEYLEESKRRGKELGAKVKKSAIVGITGMRKVFVSGYLIATGQHDLVKTFNTEQEAKDWLAT
jgi:hypothetical protein